MAIKNLIQSGLKKINDITSIAKKTFQNNVKTESYNISTEELVNLPRSAKEELYTHEQQFKSVANPKKNEMQGVDSVTAQPAVQSVVTQQKIFDPNDLSLGGIKKFPDEKIDIIDGIYGTRTKKFQMQGTDQNEDLSKIIEKYSKVADSKLISNGRKYQIKNAVEEAKRYNNEIIAAEKNTDKIKEINKNYGIEENAAKHFKNLIKEGPSAWDHAKGNHIPEYAATTAVLWGAVSYAFSNKGRQPNSQLYGSPY